MVLAGCFLQNQPKEPNGHLSFQQIREKESLRGLEEKKRGECIVFTLVGTKESKEREIKKMENLRLEKVKDENLKWPWNMESEMRMSCRALELTMVVWWERDEQKNS
uniref:Uncharacterized protein n=1 Tax=Cannabis sativa TaxID=3483 RepID=A0A803Q7Q0_CANSA